MIWGPKFGSGVMRSVDDLGDPGGRKVVRMTTEDPDCDELWLVEYACLGGDGACTLMPLREVGVYAYLGGHGPGDGVGFAGRPEDGVFRLFWTGASGRLGMVEYDTHAAPFVITRWVYDGMSYEMTPHG